MITDIELEEPTGLPLDFLLLPEKDLDSRGFFEHTSVDFFAFLLLATFFLLPFLDIERRLDRWEDLLIRAISICYDDEWC